MRWLVDHSRCSNPWSCEWVSVCPHAVRPQREARSEAPEPVTVLCVLKGRGHLDGVVVDDRLRALGVERRLKRIWSALGCSRMHVTLSASVRVGQVARRERMVSIDIDEPMG